MCQKYVKMLFSLLNLIYSLLQLKLFFFLEIILPSDKFTYFLMFCRYPAQTPSLLKSLNRSILWVEAVVDFKILNWRETSCSELRSKYQKINRRNVNKLAQLVEFTPTGFNSGTQICRNEYRTYI